MVASITRQRDIALFVYCEPIWCNHSAQLNADWLPDDMVLTALRPRMVCTACGLIGADVRPDWSQHTKAAGPGGTRRHWASRGAPARRRD
jgi:hypothetical protein